MTLSEREQRTVDLVMQCRLLTSSQIQIGASYPLGASSGSAVRRSLVKLVRNHYLDALPRRLPNEPASYLLTRRSVAGLRLLQARWGAAELKRQMTRLGSLEHLLGINNVRVRAIRATWELGWALGLWLRAEDLAARLSRFAFIPDAYFQIERTLQGQTKTASFFLELERSYKASRVLSQKLLNYADFHFSGGYAESFDKASFRVLVVFSSELGVSGPDRVRSARKQARRLGIDFVRFATLEAIRQIPPQDLLTAALWWHPAHDQPVPLYA